jgi:hypothetical protein
MGRSIQIKTLEVIAAGVMITVANVLNGRAADFEVQQSFDGSRIEVISESSPHALFFSKSRSNTTGNPSLLVMCSEKPSLCSISISALFHKPNSPDQEQEQITLDFNPTNHSQRKRVYSSLILTAAIPSGQSMEAYTLIGITPEDLKALRNQPTAILRIGSHTELVFRPISLGLERLSP